MTQQPLIPGAVPSVAPCLRGSVPARTGRGATPQRLRTETLPRPNVMGRKTLTIQYRPLKLWQSWFIAGDGVVAVLADSQLGRAEQLALDWFRRVGGLQTAADAEIRAFYDLLSGVNPDTGERYTYDLALMAIEAKADTLRGRSDRENAEKARFRGSPASFASRGLDYWLATSLAYRDWLAKRRLALGRAAREARRNDPHAAARVGSRADAAFDRARQREQDLRKFRDETDQRMRARDLSVITLLSPMEYAAFARQEADKYVADLLRAGKPPTPLTDEQRDRKVALAALGCYSGVIECVDGVYTRKGVATGILPVNPGAPS